MEKVGQEPPCDKPGGVLPDGTCQYGFPELLAENVLALEVWSDLQAVGDGAWTLHDLALSDYDREDLLVKLRIIADTVAEYQHDKAEERERKAKAAGRRR